MMTIAYYRGPLDEYKEHQMIVQLIEQSRCGILRYWYAIDVAIHPFLLVFLYMIWASLIVSPWVVSYNCLICSARESIFFYVGFYIIIKSRFEIYLGENHENIRKYSLVHIRRHNWRFILDHCGLSVVCYDHRYSGRHAVLQIRITGLLAIRQRGHIR